MITDKTLQYIPVFIGSKFTFFQCLWFTLKFFPRSWIPWKCEDQKQTAKWDNKVILKGRGFGINSKNSKISCCDLIFKLWCVPLFPFFLYLLMLLKCPLSHYLTYQVSLHILTYYPWWASYTGSLVNAKECFQIPVLQCVCFFLKG